MSWTDMPMVAQGWQCPCCGHVYSPSTPMCMVCPPKVTTGTAATLGGLPVVVDPSMLDDEFELRGKTTVRVKLK